MPEEKIIRVQLDLTQQEFRCLSAMNVVACGSIQRNVAKASYGLRVLEEEPDATLALANKINEVVVALTETGDGWIEVTL